MRGNEPVWNRARNELLGILTISSGTDVVLQGRMRAFNIAGVSCCAREQVDIVWGSLEDQVRGSA